VAARVEDDSVIELDAIDLGALLQRPDWRTAATSSAGRAHQPDQVRFAPLVVAPSKILCVGLNYLDHIRETKLDEPAYPALFTKFAATLSGANDDIPLPSCSDMVDWEAELAFVVGKDSRTSQLLFTPAALLSYVSTFTTLEPGDVISTGTPGGVGGSMTPPVFLRAGQVVETTVEGVGTCRNLCVPPR